MNPVRYNKRNEVKITKSTHTVYIPLNARKSHIIEALKNVPDNVPVSMIIGDDDNDGTGEIVFTEEIETS